MNEALSIGDLARRTGCKVPTIRYYEEIGLVGPPARTTGRQRRYSEAHLKQLAFVRHARDLGFSVEDIRSLLSLAADPNQSCEDVDRIAKEHRDAIDLRIAQLTALRSDLTSVIENCKGGRITQCRIVEVLADHSLCAHEHHAEA